MPLTYKHGSGSINPLVFFALAIQGVTTLGYGVIGSPADSGSVSLGSSPGTPAQYLFHNLISVTRLRISYVMFVLGKLSSNGIWPRRLAA